MMTTTYTQTGIAQIAQESYTSLTVINYATDTYVTTEPWSKCTAAVEEEETDLTTGATLLTSTVMSLAVLAGAALY